jgi:uncharacterized membrane protein YgcG
MRRLATIAAVAICVWLLLAAPAMAAAPAPAAGPPYPDAVTGQRVYDYAGIFSKATITEAQSIIDGIQVRTGAQVAVYTQVKPESDTLDKANNDALALMNQWGVGRKGFDDGLVILFDMQTSLRHGQVSLYAGSGYRAAFLSDSDRQAIFDNDMKPLLADGDMDGGLLAGLRDIDANSTSEHAATLERSRQINALMAVGGLALGILLIAFAVLSWLRHGRDPVYIDDNSILMPAPPDGLTPGMATILMSEKSSDRTVSAGLVDLAARGCIAFVGDTKPLGETETGIRFLGDGGADLPAPESSLRDSISKKTQKHDGYLAPHSVYRLVPAFDSYKDDLEAAAVKWGWLTAKPSQVTKHWGSIGGLELTAAIIAGFFLILVQASGLFTAALSVGAAGIFTLVLARYMPSRTRQGAMLWAMLTAYKRTLELSMADARSMRDIVKEKALPWVTTPDQVMAWGVAFGLDRKIEIVLSRSLVDANENKHDPQVAAWYPRWWLMEPVGGHSGLGASGHAVSGAGVSSGLFSASMIPNPGSIMAALGSITSPSFPASSSGSSGSSFSSGGSFGGGGGGGGGGAGGGF